MRAFGQTGARIFSLTTFHSQKFILKIDLKQEGQYLYSKKITLSVLIKKIKKIIIVFPLYF